MLKMLDNKMECQKRNNNHNQFTCCKQRKWDLIDLLKIHLLDAFAVFLHENLSAQFLDQQQLLLLRSNGVPQEQHS